MLASKAKRNEFALDPSTGSTKHANVCPWSNWPQDPENADHKSDKQSQSYRTDEPCTDRNEINQPRLVGPTVAEHTSTKQKANQQSTTRGPDHLASIPPGTN